MLFGKAVKIENCAAITIKVDDYVTREFTWDDLYIGRVVALVYSTKLLTPSPNPKQRT